MAASHTSDCHRIAPPGARKCDRTRSALTHCHTESTGRTNFQVGPSVRSGSPVRSTGSGHTPVLRSQNASLLQPAQNSGFPFLHRPLSHRGGQPSREMMALRASGTQAAVPATTQQHAHQRAAPSPAPSPALRKRSVSAAAAVLTEHAPTKQVRGMDAECIRVTRKTECLPSGGAGYALSDS